MIDYSNFPELAGVYLEDSYVLGISATPGQLVFKLDAVLTPGNSSYHDPRAGEQYCYAAGYLIFGDVSQIEWVRESYLRYTDASGEADLGNIDVLRPDGNAYVVEGDWGEVWISGTQPRFELGQ